MRKQNLICLDTVLDRVRLRWYLMWTTVVWPMNKHWPPTVVYVLMESFLNALPVGCLGANVCAAAESRAGWMGISRTFRLRWNRMCILVKMLALQKSNLRPPNHPHHCRMKPAFPHAPVVEMEFQMFYLVWPEWIWKRCRMTAHTHLRKSNLHVHHVVNNIQNVYFTWVTT